MKKKAVANKKTNTNKKTGTKKASNPKKKVDSKKGAKDAGNPDYKALGKKLKAAVKAGKLTEEEAKAKLVAAQKTVNAKRK